MRVADVAICQQSVGLDEAVITKNYTTEQLVQPINEISFSFYCHNAILSILQSFD